MSIPSGRPALTTTRAPTSFVRIARAASAMVIRVDAVTTGLIAIALSMRLPLLAQLGRLIWKRSHGSTVHVSV